MKPSNFVGTLFVGLLVLVLFLPFQVVSALPFAAADTPPPTLDLPTLLSEFMALAGVGVLVTFLVNLGKQFGLVKDGTAPTWATGLNLLLLIALFVLKVFVPNADIGALDGIAETIAQIGTLLVGLLAQFGASRAMYAVVRGVPVIGYSHSAANTASAIKAFVVTR